ncbi:protein of unknown function [Nitrospina watsonii]|uniref:Uncharacterized protein n=1 Tax=Nitrospina watsonii TaxID=1323948 RepID=A0ABN8W1P9_9BACT|nr:protein of unknown function [Nitrospina watsonii]
MQYPEEVQASFLFDRVGGCRARGGVQFVDRDGGRPPGVVCGAGVSTGAVTGAFSLTGGGVCCCSTG